MIGFLRGKIATVDAGKAVIDVAGVGYNVLMPDRAIADLPGLDEEIKVYTHLSVREDAMTLYGFLTADDLSFFRMLIGVSGVGPKYALGILSCFTASEIRLAVLSADYKTISKAPGVGLKSAQKIVLELKDKVSIDDVLNASAIEMTSQGGSVGLTDAMKDAQEALMALGYSATDSLRAVKACGCGEEEDVEVILKMALKAMKG